MPVLSVEISAEFKKQEPLFWAGNLNTQWCKLPKRLVSIRAFSDDLGLSEEMRILFYRPALPLPL